MKLLDVLMKISTKQRCTRCQKVIKGNEFKQIGQHCFCTECISTKEKILPEYILLRTPSLLEDAARSTKVLTCPVCKAVKPNPYFHSCTKDDGPYQFTWIGEKRFCYSCAVKQLPALNGFYRVQKGANCFFYPVSEKDAEESYWGKAVRSANDESKENKLGKCPEFFEMVDRIIISEYYNPNNDDLMDDDTSLYVYANAERTVWCFRLENQYISGWDGWLVYQGGFITPEQFFEFMERMHLKHHLFLFHKE